MSRRSAADAQEAWGLQLTRPQSASTKLRDRPGSPPFLPSVSVFCCLWLPTRAGVGVSASRGPSGLPPVSIPLPAPSGTCSPAPKSPRSTVTSHRPAPRSFAPPSPTTQEAGLRTRRPVPSPTQASRAALCKSPHHDKYLPVKLSRRFSVLLSLDLPAM